MAYSQPFDPSDPWSIYGFSPVTGGGYGGNDPWGGRAGGGGNPSDLLSILGGLGGIFNRGGGSSGGGGGSNVSIGTTQGPNQGSGEGPGAGSNVPWTQIGLAGLGGISGLFPKAGQKTSGQFNQDTTNITNTNINKLDQLESLLRTLSSLTNETRGTTTSTPSLGGPQQGLLDQITQQYGQRSNVNLAPYEAGQIGQINKNSDIQSQAVNNIMASRGLSTSPVAGTAAANVEGQRIGNISNFQAGLPLLQRQLEGESLGQAGGFLSSIPRAIAGTTTGFGRQLGDTSQTGHTFSEGSQNVGSITQGAISGGQQQQTSPTGSGGIGGFIQGLLPILLSLFA